MHNSYFLQFIIIISSCISLQTDNGHFKKEIIVEVIMHEIKKI